MSSRSIGRMPRPVKSQFQDLPADVKWVAATERDGGPARSGDDAGALAGGVRDLPRSATPHIDETPVPWRVIVRLAALGTIVMIVIVVWQAGGVGANPLTYVQPGIEGPSAALFRQDFPESELPAGLGLDGQQFYAMARSPLHLDDAAAHLDRPEYRWRRPLYAWTAAALHPTGGGLGLVYALILVNVAALVGGGVAAGALSMSLGGRPWPALVFPLLPGCYMSLRVSVADAMAVALALGALALLAHRRVAPAMVLGVAAALTKETMVLLLIGWAISNRARQSWLPAATATVTVAAWTVWLRLTLPASVGGGVTELVAPFTGFPRAAGHWIDGSDRLGMVASISALALSAVAIVRGGRRHPLTAVLLANLALVTVLRWNVVALDFGGTRSTLPLAVTAAVVLATPRAVT
jgi:hypothetical protein